MKNVKNIKNVESLDLDYLCTGCGACEVICPNKAIKIIIKNSVYKPEIDAKNVLNVKNALKFVLAYL